MDNKYLKRHLGKHGLTWALIVISALTFLLYALNMSDHFIAGFDDDWGIYDNPLVQTLSWENLKKIWLNNTLDCYYIPLTFSCVAVDVAIWGNNAYAMKVTNLLTFIAIGWMFYHLLKILRTPKSLAVMAVSLFLLHPIQAENLLWPACKRQILTLFFLLPALIALVRHFREEKRLGKWYWLAVFLFLCAVMAKPPALAFAALAGLMLLHTVKSPLFTAVTLTMLIKKLSPFAVISLFSVIMNAMAAHRNFLETDFAYSPLQHLLIITSSFGHYLQKMVMGPYQIFYLLPTANDFNYWRLGLLSIPAVLLFIVGVIFYRQKKLVLSAGIFWYFLALTPSALLLVMMSDFPANTADRYFLMASPGIFLLVAAVIQKVFKQYALAFLGILLVPMTLSSYKQIKVWEDALSVMEYSLAINPTEEMHYRSALLYFDRGQSEKAFSHLEAAKTLVKGASFSSPYFVDLQIAYLYQEKGDLNIALHMIVKAIKKDLDIPEGVLTDDDIVQKVSTMMPLDKDNAANAHNYIAIRESILSEYHQVQLRAKRL
jgi:tetratricopeptide (TPR) repeat protein